MYIDSVLVSSCGRFDPVQCYPFGEVVVHLISQFLKMTISIPICKIQINMVDVLHGGE